MLTMDFAMQKLWLRTLLSLAFVGLLISWRITSAGRLEPSSILSVQRPLMGTVWKIEVDDHGRPEAARKAIDAAYLELERIDRMMSEWKPESPISQVDAAAGSHAVEVPAELRELIERSIVYSRKTEGTFDITWRGMGRIWRFDDGFRVPSQAEVEAARQHINYRRIQIEANRIYLPAGTNIGLGGIAKGYAVDRAAKVLTQRGFSDSLVDGGGDVLVSGTRNGEPWRLGIQEPREEHGRILGLVKLTSKALVTSGDYERFRIVNGVRYHHIIDPRTGWPADAAMSVSILANSAEQGVVLAKGVFILGPEKGLALARQEGVEALLIDPQGKRHMTQGFAQLLEPR